MLNVPYAHIVHATVLHTRTLLLLGNKRGVQAA